MAATDYVIVAGWMNAYLTRKKKPTKKWPQTMSLDRRPITDGEMIGLFEFYLRRYCEEHKTDTVVITNSDGKKIFECSREAERAGRDKAIEPGEPADLCRTDFVPLYRKLGRERFLDLLKNNPNTADEELKRLMKEEAKK